MKPEEQEEVRKIFAQPCDFILAAASPLQFPQSVLPEVAFIGRSNVGKSSLINALTGRKGLARTSNTPGRTQQIIFFDLTHRLMLVDLPGYGHAEAPRAEKDQWNELVQTYIRQRRALKCVCLLLDSRHGVKANDLEMMNFLDRSAVIYKIIMTKIDQIRASEREKILTHVKEVAARHPAALSDIIVTSAEDKSGIDLLQAFIVSRLLTNH